VLSRVCGADSRGGRRRGISVGQVKVSLMWMIRYRLRRLTEISVIDLTDPGACFTAMLQLRVVPLR
jgi:hypothetical protein